MTAERPLPASILPFVPRGGLTFGIYHGGVVGSHHELSTGKPDSPDEINRALDRLQSDRHLIVRTYLRFSGTNAEVFPKDLPTVAQLARYTWNGRKLDLVLSNWDRTGNMARWSSFIEHAVERYGPYVQNLQICEEPNVFEYPGDGRFGHSVDAVLTGVKTAHAALRKRGLNCAVGFNSTPVCPTNDGFWPALCQRVDQVFLNALDYVGLNLYIDVAEPLVGQVEDAVEKVLTEFRNESIAQAGIPATIPIHICETGWPTGPQRFYTRQADILQSVVNKVYELRRGLNIHQFELYSLRDADTANPDGSHQFGIMRDDYSPKPAFETYRELIQQYGN